MDSLYDVQTQKLYLEVRSASIADAFFCDVEEMVLKEMHICLCINRVAEDKGS